MDFSEVVLQGSFKNKEACPSSGDLGGIFGRYLEDILRNFGGNLEDPKRRLEGKNIVFKSLIP